MPAAWRLKGDLRFDAVAKRVESQRPPISFGWLGKPPSSQSKLWVLRQRHGSWEHACTSFLTTLTNCTLDELILRGAISLLRCLYYLPSLFNKRESLFIILEFANSYFCSLSIPLIILRTSDTAAFAGSSTSSTIIRAPGNYRVSPHPAN